MYKVVSTYRYADIANPEELMEKIRGICKDNLIRGRILIGNEGINVAFSGPIISCEKLKEFLETKFPNLTYREQNCNQNVYHKLVVRVRKEIVALGKDVDLNNRGNHVKPAELKRMLDEKEEVYLLDARNEYELEIGRFKDAITLPIGSFKELPEKLNEITNLKKKKIVMYCTGGVRCEKSSAYLKEQGFEDVNQLEGGIINYINQFPDTYYEGSCFVFDDRLSGETGSTKTLSKCKHCGNQEDQFVNCHNLECDKLFICCTNCQGSWKVTCSEDCKKAPKQRPQEERETGRKVGKVLHYYPKAKTAYIEITNDRLFSGEKIVVKGKTTDFQSRAESLRLDNGTVVAIAKPGSKLTIPVPDRVRENDGVYLPFYDNKLEFLFELERESEANNIPIIGREKGSELWKLIKKINPKKILEIGTANGFSGCILGSFGAQVISIEKDPQRVIEAKNNFTKYQINATVIEGDALEKINLLNEKYDLIFLDFAKAKYLKILPYVLQKLNFQGVLVVDNVTYPALEQFRKELEQKIFTVYIDVRDKLSLSTIKEL